MTTSEEPAALPVRNGPAATLAFLMHERGMCARIRTAGEAFVLTVRNPAVPRAGLTQKIAHVPGENDGMFLWLHDRR